ncbi:MAG: hypothetical protein ACYC35_00865 [Pirellulales bacterium]
MRKPTYLSHSSLTLWGKDKEEFYIKHLAETRAPRIAQEVYMSVGAGFDAYAKSALHERLFGKGADAQFDFQAIFEKQVEAHNRDFALEAGKYIYDCYVYTGAFDELLAMLQKSKEPPRFEFEVKGVLRGVPVVGKPDCRFVHECGCHVILDWKVKGFCSKYGASPSKNYRLCRDAYGPPHKKSQSDNRPHKNYVPYDHHGLEINKFYMEASNEEYADQICMYGWLLGEQIGDEEVVCCIDEIVAKYMPEGKPLLRVAHHRARVSNAHQTIVLNRAVDCWDAITSGWIFRDMSRQENDEKCQHLEQKVIALQSDGSVEENLFAKMARPQFRK